MEQSSCRGIAASLLADTNKFLGVKTEEDDDVVNDSYETGESVGTKSNVTTDPAFNEIDSNPSFASTEFDEKPAVALIRDEVDSNQSVAKPKKKKSRAKKEDISIIPINIDYKNKPKGFSTSTKYVGDPDADEDDLNGQAFQNLDSKPVESSNENATSNANIDEEEIIVNFSTGGSNSFNNSRVESKKFEKRISELENEIITLENKSQNLLDENAQIKAQNRLLTTNNKVLKEQLDDLSTKLNQVECSSKSDSRKVVEERDKLKEKVNLMQKEVAGKQEELDRVSIEKTAFIQRIQTLEKEKKSMQKPVVQQAEMTEERNRAVCAEITVITLQKNFETDVLERALRDAKKVVCHLDTIIPKCVPEDAVAARRYQDKFKEIVVEFEASIEKMKKEFDAQIDTIKNGARLSNLKRVEPPKPPTPPPMLELKALQMNHLPSGHMAPMMMMNQHPFSARAPGDVFRPSFLHSSSSQPSMFRPPFFAQPMPMMNGFGPFERPSMPASSSSSSMPGVNGAVDSHATGAIPRVQPIGPPAVSARFPTPAGSSDTAPPGFRPPAVSPPQPSSGTNSTSNLPSNQNNESKLFAAIYGNVRRNPEPLFKENSNVQQQSCPPEVQILKRSPPPPPQPLIPAFDNAASAEEKKPSKLQTIIELFSERYPFATVENIKDAITTYRNSLPQKSLQGVSMSQLKSGLEQILTARLGPPSVSKSGSSTRASSVIDEGPFQRSDSRLYGNDECFICYEPYRQSDNNVQKLECGHEAHKECLDKWIYDNKTCPICRKWTLPDDEFPRL